MRCSVYIACPSVLIWSNLKLHQILEVKNIFKCEKVKLQLTFNHGVNVNWLSNNPAQDFSIEGPNFSFLWLFNFWGHFSRYFQGLWEQILKTKTPSTLCWRNVKTEISLPKRIKNVFRSHYPGRIKERNNHRPFWICFVSWGNLVQGNNMIIKSIEKLCFQIFSVHSSVFGTD